MTQLGAAATEFAEMIPSKFLYFGVWHLVYFHTYNYEGVIGSATSTRILQEELVGGC